MPQNLDLEPITLPMSLRFGEEPRTEFVNNLDALNVHRNAQHMIDFRPKVKDYVKSIKLQILKPC